MKSFNTNRKICTRQLYYHMHAYKLSHGILAGTKSHIIIIIMYIKFCRFARESLGNQYQIQLLLPQEFVEGKWAEWRVTTSSCDDGHWEVKDQQGRRTSLSGYTSRSSRLSWSSRGSCCSAWGRWGPLRYEDRWGSIAWVHELQPLWGEKGQVRKLKLAR